MTDPTHYCTICAAKWRRNPDNTWSLCQRTCGTCCDNAVMGDQIKPLGMTDLTKPVQTACGYPARVLATKQDGPDGCSIVVEIKYPHGGVSLYWYCSDGTYPGADHLTLVNVPPPEPLMVTIRMTPEDAANCAWMSDIFCDVTGCGGDNHSGYLARFTALAEQQRGEG